MNMTRIPSAQATAPLPVQVVEAVAERDDTDARMLPPLAETIDPDALDSLFDPQDQNELVTEPATLSFHYADRRLVVRSDQTITVK